MLRFSVVKLGKALEEIADIPGETEEWSHKEGGRGAPVAMDPSIQMADYELERRDL
jgi:hypothetical protein